MQWESRTACAKLSHKAKLSTGALTMDTMNTSDASDAGNTPSADGEVESCHAKGCGLPATNTCDRCERRFCATHCTTLVLQRRDDASERTTHHGMLTRMPMRTESYTLCATCRNKPVPRNLPPLHATAPANQSAPQSKPQNKPKPSSPSRQNPEITNRWSEAWSADDE